MTGIIKGYEVKKNRDGSKNVLMLNCEITGPDDIQSIQYMSAAGDFQIPPIGSLVYILTAGQSWKIAIASLEDTDFDSSVNEGERKFQATGGAYIKLNDNGEIELNGDSDTAISYTDLNTALQTFITDLNSKLVTAFTAVGGVWPGTSLDISGAEVDKVKLP